MRKLLVTVSFAVPERKWVLVRVSWTVDDLADKPGMVGHRQTVVRNVWFAVFKVSVTGRQTWYGWTSPYARLSCELFGLLSLRLGSQWGFGSQ